MTLAAPSTGAMDEGEPPGGLPSIRFRLDRRLPVADQVHDVLRAAIVGVHLLPGTSISENSISRQFGVSRTPIRAAIQRLAEEGLIDVYPQQGSFVAPIKLGGIGDAHFVRRALEVAVLRETAEIWSPAMSEAARAVPARQVDLLQAGDLDGFHAADAEFHHLLMSFANRDGVWTTIQTAWTRLSRFMRLLGAPDRLPLVIEEHLAIIDALDAGDAAGAEARLVYHVDRAFVLLDQLPDRYRCYVAD
jgi:GntR family transcriptional regulator, rspAB operon transcriptional repressor